MEKGRKRKSVIERKIKREKERDGEREKDSEEETIPHKNRHLS